VLPGVVFKEFAQVTDESKFNEYHEWQHEMLQAILLVAALLGAVA
jgi:hypothetical protein